MAVLRDDISAQKRHTSHEFTEEESSLATQRDLSIVASFGFALLLRHLATAAPLRHITDLNLSNEDVDHLQLCCPVFKITLFEFR